MKKDIDLSSIWTNPLHFIACGFGIGALPIMPGTYATFASVLLYLMLVKLPVIWYAATLLLLIVAGVFLCEKVNRDFGTDDHPAAVWDELVTFPLALMGVPPRWYWIVLAVALFRVFDIWKPGPIGWVDKHIHGGVGVMLDDVMAAVVTWGIVFTLYAICG